MIREQGIFRGVIAHYTGTPVYKIFLDGSLVSTVTAPTHATYKTRLITVGQGAIGYIPHITSNDSERSDLQPVMDNMSNYSDLRLWDRYEITFTGQITVSMYLDNTTTAVVTSKVLTTTLAQDTQYVYFPANSYGRVQYIVMDVSGSNTGAMMSQRPMAKEATSLTDTPLMIMRSITVMYKSQPQIAVSLDGSSIFTVSASILPSHTNFKPRIISLPSGNIGYFPHFSSTDSQNIADFNFGMEPANRFVDQVLWHYYEITFTGTVNVSLYVDNTLKVGDGDDASSSTNKKTLTTTKTQETVKVYLPALCYGRIPHVLNDKTDTGQVISWNPVSLPARFYKTLEGVSEGQITYRGSVFVDFFIDGNKIGETYQFDSVSTPSQGEVYTSSKFYFSESVGGHVFQYIQVSGDGDIISIDTDAHQLDLEPTTSAEPI